MKYLLLLFSCLLLTDQVAIRFRSSTSPIVDNEHPRIIITSDNRSTIKARINTSGEWNDDFQSYVDWITDTDQWDNPSTNQGLISLRAAGAAFVYQMFEGGTPTGTTFPSHADTQAEWGNKAVE